MSQLRWLDKTQPQTLMMATIILYINAALGLLTGELLYFPIGTLLVVGQVAAGLGIANQRRWGYWIGVALVALFLLYIVLHFSFPAIINLLFYGALLALLLHRQSREYQRVWFRW